MRWVRLAGRISTTLDPWGMKTMLERAAAVAAHDGPRPVEQSPGCITRAI